MRPPSSIRSNLILLKVASDSSKRLSQYRSERHGLCERRIAVSASTQLAALTRWTKVHRESRNPEEREHPRTADYRTFRTKIILSRVSLPRAWALNSLKPSACENQNQEPSARKELTINELQETWCSHDTQLNSFIQTALRGSSWTSVAANARPKIKKFGEHCINCVEECLNDDKHTWQRKRPCEKRHGKTSDEQAL